MYGVRHVLFELKLRSYATIPFTDRPFIKGSCCVIVILVNKVLELFLLYPPFFALSPGFLPLGNEPGKPFENTAGKIGGAYKAK